MEKQNKELIDEGSLPKGSPRGWTDLLRWFDTDATSDDSGSREPQRVDWVRCVPFWGIHVMCLGVFWVGWSWTAVTVTFLLYVCRMFAITGFYHRYFSHRSFKTSRLGQFLFGILGASAAQRSPLWWAAYHRPHHRWTDTERDVHSPIQYGFLWSHIGWFTSKANFRTDLKTIPDLAKFPELRFLHRFDSIVPVLLAFTLYILGAGLEVFYPGLGTNGQQMLIWGFFISTVVLYHATYSINSLAHLWGSQRYETNDYSRNNFFLALITFGEGWHNNHHRYPASVRQGFYWWEIDLTYYGLVVLSWLGLIWDLKPVPEHIKTSRLVGDQAKPSYDRRTIQEHG